MGRFPRPKLIESRILEKPASTSPNLRRRTHLANNTSKMPKTTTAAHPSVIPAICALLSGDGPPELAGVAVGIDAGDVVQVGAVVAGNPVAPVETVAVGVGVVVTVAVAVPVLLPVPVLVPVAAGTSRAPVPDGGTTRVATMVEWVLDAASETPTHMLYAVAVMSPAKG